jgi:hypothetical protein
MVASAYFALTANSDALGAKRPIQDKLESDIIWGQTEGNSLFWTRYPIPRDSLSPLSQQLIQRDVLRLILPIGAEIDRGRVLEESWNTLRVPFSALAEAERHGSKPSLLLSPVFAETGAPLYISNLDLGELGNRNLEEPITDRSGPLEFFKLFPGAETRFKVSTAVRMNATFPYISPIVSLPTSPPRGLVDAGYYDNYGVSPAVAYLHARSIKAWIEEHTSGVIIIQIRAFRSDAPVERNLPPQCKDLVSRGSGGGSFAWLTEPVAAAASARELSMKVRNDLELKQLQELYPKDFLKTVVFENTARASLSWYLPKAELDCMVGELESGFNKQSFASLAKWWSEAK